MIPSKRVYLLLVIGIAIALSLTDLTNVTIGITASLLFDAIVLVLMLIDYLRLTPHRVQVTRQPLSRLSIGRDNPVVLSIKSGNYPAEIQIRDYYPQDFGVSTPNIKLSLPANTTQEFTYTVCPRERGEFAWGDIQVRTLVPNKNFY